MGPTFQVKFPCMSYVLGQHIDNYTQCCFSINNESTAGADASVEVLKLYDIKLLTLAYLALYASSLASSRSLTM